jgi:NADH:ubiquinone oxidoreductase subunit K
MSGISHNIDLYFALSISFFVFGVVAVLTRKNAVGIFMGVELMLNAAALNFVTFEALKKNSLSDQWKHGHIFALFIIILAAIEAAVALAIVLRVFAVKQSIDPDLATELKG